MLFLQQKRVAGCRVVLRERKFLVCMGVMHLLLAVAVSMVALLLWRDEIDMPVAVYMVVQYPLFQDVGFLGYRGGR
jgi:hypothetical protein